MSFGIPVRNGLGVGLLSLATLLSRSSASVPSPLAIRDRAGALIFDRAGATILTRV